MALWTPAEITTDQWLDASDASTITIDTGVSQWDDKSGNARHVSQADTTKQPAYDSVSKITFDGSNDFLSGGDILDIRTDALNVFVVGNITGSNGTLFAKSLFATADGRYAITKSAGDLLAVAYFDASHDVTSAGYTNENKSIFCQLIERDLHTLLVDGVSLGTNSFTEDSADYNTAYRFLLGAYNNATDTGEELPLNGAIYEVVVIRGTLADADRYKIEGYLAWKHGTQASLPSGHTYKSAAPMEGVELTASASSATVGGRETPLADITFVGSATGDAETANFDITLPECLEGDIVIVAAGSSDNGDVAVGVTTSGYVEIADLHAVDNHHSNLSVSWKRMGSTPDTVVNVYGTQTSSRWMVGIAYVLRGVDDTTALDVTVTTAVGGNSAIPNPPAITPVTDGSLIVVCGLGTEAFAAGDPDVTPPVGYSNQALKPSPSTVYSCTAAIASKLWTVEGAEDPAPWTDWITGTQEAWCAVTLALRPSSAAPTSESYSIMRRMGINALKIGI